MSGFNTDKFFEQVAKRKSEQSAASIDNCTDADNCRRCQTIPKHRGDMQHAGIGSYPAADPKFGEEE